MEWRDHLLSKQPAASHAHQQPEKVSVIVNAFAATALRNIYSAGCGESALHARVSLVADWKVNRQSFRRISQNGRHGGSAEH
jgi:hypothetical protein